VLLDVGSTDTAAVTASSAIDTWSLDCRQLHCCGNVFQGSSLFVICHCIFYNQCLVIYSCDAVEPVFSCNNNSRNNMNVSSGHKVVKIDESNKLQCAGDQQDSARMSTPTESSSYTTACNEKVALDFFAVFLSPTLEFQFHIRVITASNCRRLS